MTSTIEDKFAQEIPYKATFDTSTKGLVRKQVSEITVHLANVEDTKDIDVGAQAEKLFRSEYGVGTLQKEYDPDKNVLSLSYKPAQRFPAGRSVVKSSGESRREYATPGITK